METYSNGLVLVRIQNKHKNIRKEVIILKCLSTTEEKIVGIVVLKSSPRMQQKKTIGSIKEMLKDIQIDPLFSSGTILLKAILVYRLCPFPPHWWA